MYRPPRATSRQPRWNPQYNLPAELLQPPTDDPEHRPETPPPGAGDSLSPELSFSLLLSFEDEAPPQRWRMQDLPSCRLSCVRKAPGVPFPGGDRAGERRGESKGNKISPSGVVTRVTRPQIPRDAEPTPFVGVYAAVSNHDNDVSSSVSVCDLGTKHEHPVVQIHVASLILSHDLSPQLDLAIGLMSGEVLVYSVVQGVFTFRTPSPGVRERTRKLGATLVGDEQGASCVGWQGDTDLVVGHRNGVLYWHSRSVSAFEPLKFDSSSPTVAVRRQSRQANPQMALRLSHQPLLHLAVSPKRGMVAVACRDGNCYIVDTATNRVALQLASKFGAVLCCAWSECSRYIATGGQDDVVTFYSIDPPQRLAYLGGPQNWISSVVIGPMRPDNSCAVFAACMDTKLYVWDVDARGLAGEAAENATSPALSPTQVLFTDSNVVTTLAAPSWRTRLAVPEVDCTASIERLHLSMNDRYHCPIPLYGVALLPEFLGIATACSQGVLHVWSGAASTAATASATSGSQPVP